ncbi:MAG: hypothetical protein AB1757_19580 [Acidobacteriota bacterium]
MVNILSIRCSLAFIPYLLESLNEFIERGEVTPALVKQAASGLMIRADERLSLRYQNQEVGLARSDAIHFRATLELRNNFFAITRTSNEVILAQVDDNLLLSHPQSEIWLDSIAVHNIIAVHKNPKGLSGLPFPDWLSVSASETTMLLSDGRNGRWVLLGDDHLLEFEKRVAVLRQAKIQYPKRIPPTIQMKGVKIYFQSLQKLILAIKQFSETGDFQPFIESSASYSLFVQKAPEGMKISDNSLVISITQKEARKWIMILEAELDKYQVEEFRRGQIHTLMMKMDDGYWLLQGGDEIFIEATRLSDFLDSNFTQQPEHHLVFSKQAEFHLILNKANGNCVALKGEEINRIAEIIAKG